LGIAAQCERPAVLNGYPSEPGSASPWFPRKRKCDGLNVMWRMKALFGIAAILPNKTNWRKRSVSLSGVEPFEQAKAAAKASATTSH